MNGRWTSDENGERKVDESDGAWMVGGVGKDKTKGRKRKTVLYWGS